MRLSTENRRALYKIQHSTQKKINQKEKDKKGIDNNKPFLYFYYL